MSPRAIGRAVDGILLAVLLGVGVRGWSPGITPMGITLDADTPAWAGFRDGMLDGPDAGRWAEQAMALRDGRPDRLDPHRMPTWSIVTAGVSRVGRLSIPHAGHLVNHTMHLLLGPILYGCARLLGLGRGAAFATGVLVLSSPPLLLASRRFGVDTTVAFVWPAALLAALAGARRPRFSPLGGVAAALAAAAHFSTLPAPVPLFLAQVLAAPVGTRWRSALGFGGGLLAAGAVIVSIAPPMPVGMLLGSFAEGIAPTHNAGQVGDTVSPWLAAARVLREGMGTAAQESRMWLSGLVRPARFPVEGLLALLPLGILAPTLAGRPDRIEGAYLWWPRRLRIVAERLTRGLSGGLAPALMLAPIPVFFIARAPGRYIDNLLPIAFLLLVRGLATIGFGVDRAVAARWTRWPVGLTAPVLAAAFAWPVVRGPHDSLVPMPPAQEDVALWAAGRQLQGMVAPGDGVATRLGEVSALAEAWSCPWPQDCPLTADEAAYAACLAQLDSACRGEGDVVWVVAVRKPTDDRSAARAGMDAWVSERWTPVFTRDLATLSLRIVPIPRAALRR